MPQQYKVILETPQGSVELQVGKNEYVLDAALRQDLPLPHTCLQGWCITCAGRLVEGRADQSDALRVFPQDKKAGFVLLCSAKPLSDLRIRTHQQEALKKLRQKHGLPEPLG